MAEPQKKSTAAFWTTVVVTVLLFFYPLSLGPACWMAGMNETAMDVIPVAYYPILWIVRSTRQEVAPGQFQLGWADNCIEWYSNFGRGDGFYPALRANGERVWCCPPDPDPGP